MRSRMPQGSARLGAAPRGDLLVVVVVPRSLPPFLGLQLLGERHVADKTERVIDAGRILFRLKGAGQAFVSVAGPPSRRRPSL